MNCVGILGIRGRAGGSLQFVPLFHRLWFHFLIFFKGRVKESEKGKYYCTCWRLCVFQRNQQRDKLSNIVLKIGTDITVILYDYHEITHFNPT